MNKKAKRNKQLENIKKKLTAATAMLLVASTMMVSTTYAWFTLSTAPEVTGISTTVGANGSLEIALANTAGDATTVESNVGDSMATNDVTAANLTWGNLVDLSDAYYGLNKIVLQPAELNALSANQVHVSNPLKYPVYGADGRVSETNSNTQLAVYNETGSKWDVKDIAYGVKAVGTVSGQSETVVALREARSQLSQKAADARNAAENTLNTNGDTLGNIVIKKALEEDGAPATFNQTEVDAMKNMIAGLEISINHVGEALKYAALGRSASGEYSDTKLYEAVKAEINAEGSTLESVLKVFYGTVGTDGKVTEAASIPSEDKNGGVLIAAYNKYNATKTAISTAKTQINALTSTDGSYTWDQIKDPLAGLVQYDNIKVNGDEVSNLKSNISGLVNNVLKNGIKVEMPTGSGVISDIADLAGNYSASITLKNVKYKEIEVEELPATMITEGITPDHLANNSDYIKNKGAITSGTTSTDNATFTDTYGYIIDLFFRTNVAGSNLLLQTEAVDRVYSDSTEGATMGHGSTMVFTSDNTTVFSETQMRQLMECIRLVFMDKTGTVLANGKLEVSGANEATTEGTAKLTGKVFLYDEDGTKLEGDNAVLSSLTQNEGKMVSVLVYLDGNEVDNTMVANAKTSMTGTLNLQFASSATLVPMENNQIRDIVVNEDASGSENTDSNEAAAKTYTVTITPTDSGVTVDKASAKAGETVTITNTTGKTVTGKYGDGNTDLTITDGKFTMPEGNVTITVA